MKANSLRMLLAVLFVAAVSLCGWYYFATPFKPLDKDKYLQAIFDGGGWDQSSGGPPPKPVVGQESGDQGLTVEITFDDRKKPPRVACTFPDPWLYPDVPTVHLAKVGNDWNVVVGPPPLRRAGVGVSGEWVQSGSDQQSVSPLTQWTEEIPGAGPNLQPGFPDNSLTSKTKFLELLEKEASNWKGREQLLLTSLKNAVENCRDSAKRTTYRGYLDHIDPSRPWVYTDEGYGRTLFSAGPETNETRYAAVPKFHVAEKWLGLVAYRQHPCPVSLWIKQPDAAVIFKTYNEQSDNYSAPARTARTRMVASNPYTPALPDLLLHPDEGNYGAFRIFPLLLSWETLLKEANGKTTDEHVREAAHGSADFLKQIFHEKSALARLEAEAQEIARRAGGPRGSYSPHSYLYCYFLLDLIELDRIGNNLRGLDDPEYKTAAELTDGLADTIHRLATNLGAFLNDGGRLQQLNAKDQDWDHSVCQITLYTLLKAREQLEGSPDSNKQLESDIIKLSTAMHDPLYRETTPYTSYDGTKSLQLRPGYFLAGFALAEYAYKSPQEKNDARQKVIAELIHETTKDGNFRNPTSRFEGWGVQYGWLYWIRVFEVFEEIQARNHDPVSDETNSFRAIVYAVIMEKLTPKGYVGNQDVRVMNVPTEAPFDLIIVPTALKICQNQKTFPQEPKFTPTP